ncbi:hypothetical protein AB0F42_30165 [Streptomyces buecherae]|uniref:hypothetical protein n=1 Tax=Streptomyces buecherae TaxID=2763006 RepID=UPI0033EEE612
MKIQDRTVPANRGVPVRIYRPVAAQSTVVWLHLEAGTRWPGHRSPLRHPDRAACDAVVVSVNYRRPPSTGSPPRWTALAPYRSGQPHAAELGIDLRRALAE